MEKNSYFLCFGNAFKLHVILFRSERNVPNLFTCDTCAVDLHILFHQKNMSILNVGIVMVIPEIRKRKEL